MPSPFRMAPAALFAAGLLRLAAAAQLPLYKIPGLPVDERVDDLVGRMNLEEKVNQLVLPFGAKFPLDYQRYNKSGLGATYPLHALPGEQWWETRNNWQRNAVENSRLGIPTSFIEETLHSSGNSDTGTVFPMPCLQGSTWNRDLVQAAASVIALEASAAGIDRGFSPVLHFCTDPRFGRCEESFGEDPGLVSAMGVAALTGLAGPGSAGAASTYLPEPEVHVTTEAKHYAAYAYCGRDGGCPAEISPNTLYDVYLKPWYQYAQAGGRAMMAAHNEVNGMPCHANPELNHALRETFGFGKGLCASDAGDVSGVAGYRIAADQLHAGALSLLSGMDQDLEYPGAFDKVPDMLQQGLLNMSVVDRAVGNVIRQKVAAGLFDGNPKLLYVDPARHKATVGAKAHRDLARTMAEEGITLLKNDHLRLPLIGLGSTMKTVAVIGPNSDNAHSHLGIYGSDRPKGGVVTVLNATVAAANASGNSWVVKYEKGSCLGGTPGCPCMDGTYGPGNVEQHQKIGDYSMPCDVGYAGRIPAATKLAAEADITLLVIGDMSTLSTSPGFKPSVREVATVGEHFDRDSLDPAGAQLELLKSVVAASQNVIVVLIHGRTVTFGAGPGDGYNAAFTSAAAVLAAWHPGEEGGTAVWNILSGRVNPSGRTAHTWPRTVGQVHQYVPWYLEQRTRPPSAVYADYAPATPLVPFGFGLSYSNYSFANVQLDCPKVANVSTIVASDVFNVSLDITNHGAMDGKIVVQVYFSQNLASRVRFSKMLLSFAKIEVKAGQTFSGAKVSVKARDLEMWDQKRGKYVVESSSYSIMVGQSSVDQQTVSHTLKVTDKIHIGLSKDAQTFAI